MTDRLGQAIARVNAHAGSAPNPRTEASHARIAANIAREWWTVNRQGETIEVFFHPPQTLAEVRTLYPKAEVAPR